MELIQQVFADNQQQVHVLKESEDPAEVIRQALPGADLIAVYGGDGSVTASASALIGTGTPLAIIPGGTANVLSKEFGIPQDTTEALQMIRNQQYRLQTIDTGIVNETPFLLRVNLGIMADMITETDPDLKDKIGQLAYGVTTVKSIRKAEAVAYHLTIDGNTMQASGVSLTVTNSGSMGIGGLQMQPGISVSDGLLDVLLLRDADVLSILKTVGTSLLGKETNAVTHWTCKKITIKLPHPQKYICDDCEREATELNISIVPASLTVAVPLNE